MDMLELSPVVDAAGVQTVCRVADAIWREHYAAILDPGQIDYMLATFQSPGAVQEQIEQGYFYYLFLWEGAPVGYLSIHPEKDRLFLSKLYVDKAHRGHGIARSALRFLKGLCREEGLASIYLTVNKHNAHSIEAYKRLGFVKAREQTVDIGNGYVMDDYVMEKLV